LPLTPGTRLGVYDITAQIGEGGMGQVYRATDTKLKRQVAIKILPPSLAADADRLARFQREAEVLASLNHPHIAAIYGIEESAGATALVMELVEGDDLSQRIARGSIPLDEALPIATQIADALEAAHERGIVHRDLKPANIKVRPDATVKVLDFGLAKATEPAGGSSPSLSMSPTLSLHATQAGMILGTAAYMSPEQARGKPVDRRTDVWAFGCVLYEMLTGRHAFEPGETVSDAIVSVLSREPDWSALPADTPSSIRRLLRRCLNKDPQQRLPHIGAARLEIDDARAGGAEEVALAASTVAGQAQVGGWRRALPWAIAAGALALAGALLMVSSFRRQATMQPLHISADIGADVSFSTAVAPGAFAALSQDGSLLAFVAQKNAGPSQLYVRRLDQLAATLLPGTDFASNPFFSPDGQWIGFFVRNTLKKIAISGGAAVTVCTTPSNQNNRGGTWTDDGMIIFGATNGSLMRVAAAGGTPEPATALAEGELTQRWPQVLPGGKAVLFTGHSTAGFGFDDANIVVQAQPAGARKIVMKGGYYARYASSGHLLFIRSGTLYAAPFSLERLEVTGPAAPIVEGVTSNANQGTAHFAVSGSGTLLYRSSRDNQARIVWMSRDSRTAPLRETRTDWANLLFAPDGRRFAVDVSDGKQTDIWAYEWEGDRFTRLTLGPGDAQRPVWTPDGTRIVFASTRDGQNMNLYWQRADGTGRPQRLTESRNNQGAWSFHPNGRLLAFHELMPNNLDDILILSIEGDEVTGWKPGKPTVFLGSPFAERAPMFSPDGRWIAYQSTESGLDEVYVQPYPPTGGGGRWLISSGGGTMPTWSRTKRELFYATPDEQIMVVSYKVEGSAFHADKPRLWADGRFLGRFRTGPTRSFDLHPDGARFALAPASEASAKQDRIIFVSNFFDELRRRVPVK
jgi:serine/threonine-protein kinase